MNDDWDWIDKAGDALALFFVAWFIAKTLLAAGAVIALVVLVLA